MSKSKKPDAPEMRANICEQLQPLAVSIDTLSFDAANARKHSERNIEAIKSSLALFGQRKPLVVQKKGMIVRAGNGTLAAAQELGWTHVAANVIDEDNATAMQFAIADNRTAELAEWDDEVLASLLDTMDEEQRKALAFNKQDMDELLARLEPEGMDEEEKTLDDIADELPGAAALKSDLRFESPLIYEIPELIVDMCAEMPEGPIATWCGPHRSNLRDAKTWLWPWQSTSLVAMPPMSSVIPCFYVDDYRFEGLWSETDRWATRLINAGVRTVIAPNYSLLGVQPLASHIWNIYRSRWVARYLQEVGIKVIPDVQSWPRDREFALETLPKGLPVVACECHAGVKNEDDFKSRVDDLKLYDEVVQPQSWLIYGGPIASKIVERAGLSDKCVLVKSRNEAMSASRTSIWDAPQNDSQEIPNG